MPTRVQIFAVATHMAMRSKYARVWAEVSSPEASLSSSSRLSPLRGSHFNHAREEDIVWSCKSWIAVTKGD